MNQYSIKFVEASQLNSWRAQFRYNCLHGSAMLTMLFCTACIIARKLTISHLFPGLLELCCMFILGSSSQACIHSVSMSMAGLVVQVTET